MRPRGRELLGEALTKSGFFDRLMEQDRERIMEIIHRLREDRHLCIRRRGGDQFLETRPEVLESVVCEIRTRPRGLAK
jgi:hypothetical protein